MKSKKDWCFIALIIISSLLIFWRINDKYILFTDELLFEEASYRMAFSGQKIIPILDNQVWAEKPPLYFWLTSTTFGLFSQLKSLHPLTENLFREKEFIYPWIRRFWTDIAGVITVGFVYGVAKLFSDVKKSLLAGFLLLASPLFLGMTKTASLDITATACITGGIYFYLKGKNKIKYLVISGLLIGLGIMARSFLALTPLVVIFVYHLWRLTNRQIVKWSPLFIVPSSALLVVLPWHWYVWNKFPREFVEVYLKYNFFGHGLDVPDGYSSTNLFFYLIILLTKVPWLVSVLIGGTLFIWYEKLNKNKSNSKFLNFHLIRRGASLRLDDKTESQNNLIVFLLTWLFIPLLALSLVSTRHEWYLIQALPPLAILMAFFIARAYRALKICKTCLAVKYLAEITFFTFTLASIFSVITVNEPSASVVQVVRWLKANNVSNSPVYVLGQYYLPQTMLFFPQKFKVINEQELSEILRIPNDVYYIYISNIEKFAISNSMKVHQTFTAGVVYKVGQGSQ